MNVYDCKRAMQCTIDGVPSFVASVIIIPDCDGESGRQ